MAGEDSGELMQALMAKLYDTITGNDGNIKMPRNKFVTWMLPGIPFSTEDFWFCAKGLIGESAEKTQELQHQAWFLSKLFDFVPDVAEQFVDNTMQQTIFTSTQDSISSIYRDVLKYSKVLDYQLSEEEKEKLNKYRNLLTVTKEVEDLISGQKKTVTEPGPLTVAYTTFMNNYIDAADEYMNLLIDAQSAKGTDAEAIRRVSAFSNKSKFVRKKMEAAEMAWVSQGYKNDYEAVSAYIGQVTAKSMVLYKQDLLRKFDNGLMTSVMEGTAGDFYYTTLIPGNFALSPGWSRFYFYEGDYELHHNKNTSQWGAAAGLKVSLFSVGAKAGGSKTETASDMKATKFSAEFEFTQIPICRPWFDPGIFSMRAWTLDKIWDLNFEGKKLSDGAEKPSGRLVAYPITALFVRNVKFSFGERDSQTQYAAKQLQAGGAIGFGPFHVGGTYSRGSETRSTQLHTEGADFNIDGIQLIGFINNVIPKSPDPDPRIKPEQFV